VELEPRNPSSHNNLGLSLFEQMNHEEAIACFTEAIGIDDTNPTFYNNRGLALYHHNELDSALSDMNEAVALDSSKKPDPNYYFNRGNTRLARHEPEKALTDFGEALRLNSDDPRYLHSLGLARQQIPGEEHLALLQFQKALKKDEHHTPSRYHCGLMLHRLGQLEPAVRVFNHGKGNTNDRVYRYLQDRSTARCQVTHPPRRCTLFSL
jgi:tetratricopeptide (TPR) repeat protein